MRYYILIFMLLFQWSCSSSAQQVKNDPAPQARAERKPFQKSDAVMKPPKSYLNRDTEKGEYDPKPKVVLVDKKSGKYELRWIGFDGKEKIVAYQRADAVDAVVESKVEKLPDNKIIYKYLIKVLPTSPTYLSSFTIQTFAKDIKTTETDDVYIGAMTNSLSGFSDGVWWRFAILGETLPKIEAGKSVEFSLTSTALPGIVGCRGTAGNLTLKGAGEHMPTELENAIPGYEEWAKCYAIAPVEKLAGLNKEEKANYLLENLPKFLEAGWMTNLASKKYEAIFKRNDLEGALNEAKNDLENGIVTTEVFYIIENLNQ